MEGLFEKITAELRENGVEGPRLEARMIFGAVLGLDYAQISGRESVSAEQEKKILAFAEKRLNYMPLDKILGKKFFYKNEFFVDENVLSPRPDTEILVEQAIDIAQKNDAKTILDMGIGSGCILFSILSDCKDLQGVGIDISSKALEIAEKNMNNMLLGDRAKLYQKSWHDADMVEFFPEKFDMIVSNPPYIPVDDEEFLMPEVKNYDPKIALFAGKDGLDEYKKIAEVIPKMLKDNGFLLFEVGINQAEKVRNIFENAGFSHIETIKDLSGIDRCVIFKK